MKFGPISGRLQGCFSDFGELRPIKNHQGEGMTMSDIQAQEGSSRANWYFAWLRAAPAVSGFCGLPYETSPAVLRLPKNNLDTFTV